MSLHVHVQKALHNKPFLADVTAVGSILAVSRLHVYLQRRRLSKLPTAQRALVRSLSGMYDQVHVQRALSRKLLPALITHVRLDAVVKIHVVN